MGHSGIDSAGHDDEVKLFVNTMIAAYKAGLHAPKVSILENKEYNSRKINNIYLSYEKQLNMTDSSTGGLLDAKEDVFFISDDVNLVEGDQTLRVEYYLENPFGADKIVVDSNEIQVTKLTNVPGCGLCDAATEAAADPNAIVSGKVYRFAVPLNYLRILLSPTTPTDLADEGGDKEQREIDDQQTDVGKLKNSKLNSARIFVEVTATLKKPNATLPQEMTTIKPVSIVRVQMFDLE